VRKISCIKTVVPLLSPETPSVVPLEILQDLVFLPTHEAESGDVVQGGDDFYVLALLYEANHPLGRHGRELDRPCQHRLRFHIQ
jgi:hypothetical protein